MLDGTIPRVFEDLNVFQDDVLGQLLLNDLERDLIDTPEFQRLFRTSQLGFVDFVYQCANHTRGIHSIGCCGIAKRLIDSLNHNTKRLETNVPLISAAERVLISAGALLHDISHGPFAHDIEKKTHEIYPDLPKSASPAVKRDYRQKVKSAYGVYEKHDNWELNPALYVAIFDVDISVLARVLLHYSPTFWALIKSAAASFPSIGRFVECLERFQWENAPQEILPQLLFHLLVHEKFEEAVDAFEIPVLPSFTAASPILWGLGPGTPLQRKALHEAWYQPFRHDIIGDTLSADLLDYLHRDARRLGIKKSVDEKLLNHHVLTSYPSTATAEAGHHSEGQQGLFAPSRTFFRCAIDLTDRKRGTVRTERLNDLFRMLEFRHEIHEKAVVHRVVQAAITMMSRSLLTLPAILRPSLEEMYGVLPSTSPALSGEDRFLELLVRGHMQAHSAADGSMIQSLPQKLAERRMYKPLMVIPGDNVRVLLQHEVSDNDSAGDMEHTLRELAALVDSEFYRPFFTYVSNCIEDILQHSLREDELDEEFSHSASDVSILTRLLEQQPCKRVGFSALPYKQLYKDPAVLVKVGSDGQEVVTTVDRLPDEDTLHESLRNRVRAGMADMEEKYAALWKLYVFVSDGLFYSGALATLFKLPCAESVDAHREHVVSAQRVVIRALRAAWHYWEYHRKPDSIDLNASCTVTHLESMLRCFTSNVSEGQAFYEDLRKQTSAMQVDRYIHSRSDNANCRDIRYKYDRHFGSSLDTLIRQLELDKENARVTEEFLRVCQADISSIPAEEASEMIARLSSDPTELSNCVSSVAARGETGVDFDRVRHLWRKSREKTRWSVEKEQ